MSQPARVPAAHSLELAFTRFSREVARFRAALRSAPSAQQALALDACPWADGGEDVLIDLESWADAVPAQHVPSST